MQKLAFASLLLFLFQLHSRILDLSLGFLHIPILSLYTAVLASFLGGGFFRAFSNRVGILLLAFTAWMILGVPFSVWPGGAAHFVEDWIKSLLVFIVIVGLIRTFTQLRKVLHLLAWSILVLALLALVFGDMRTGRLVLERGRFTNPNDLAQILLMGLPFWWYIATNRSLKRSRRNWAFVAMIPILVALLKTGSRGAMIAALAVGLVWFWRSSVSHKVVLLVGVLAMVSLAAAFLPQTLKDRYFTFVSADDETPESALEQHMEASAVSSTYSRMQLLKDSLTLTAYNPIFGVGAGQFEVAQDLYSWAVRHQKGAWQVTHNTFTEVSSECGLPALFFYLAVIFFSFRWCALPRSRAPLLAPKQKPTPLVADLASASFCLRLALLSYVVSAIFASFAYQTQMPVLAGLVVAFTRVARLELELNEQPEAVVERPFGSHRRQRRLSLARPAA